MGWLVQIYDVTDGSSQELIAGLLSGIDTLTVESSTSGSRHFVVVECADSMQAQSVFKLVRSIDFGARLLHTTNASNASEKTSVAAG
jgi:hypothetical protein